ncbi:AAA family ATPase [Comamonas odontotermitis]|uniref:AAA family ATPase n=1 Tax=Comamonas odontotermitis TaxID=379895 RepID=UPI001CC69494|nr:AAA family ATPase [Comamonas odontotermitis]UBB16299.1 AAA family ATPase [Comamonas odontotermitis]
MSDSRIPASPTPVCAELLHARQLRLSIDPASLGFASTAELVNEPFSWIGQQRAQAAAEFGLGLDQPDYHLFVLGEEGSGRTSLLRQAMQAEAARRPAAPDIAFVHNFAVPERPLAVRLPAGQGRVLKKRIEGLIDKLPEQLDKAVNEAQHRRQIEQLYNQARLAEEAGFASLRDWASCVGLRIRREEGQLVVESAADPAENADSASPADPNAQAEPGAEDSNDNFEENEALAQYGQAPLAINTEASITEAIGTEPSGAAAISATAPAEGAVVVQLNLPAADSAPQAAASAEAPANPAATAEPPPPTIDLEYQLRLQLAQFRGQLRQAHSARDAALHLFYQSLATPLWQAGAAQALDGLNPAPEHAATLQRWLSQMQAEWLKNMTLWVPRSIAQDADALLDTTDSIEGEGESQDARDDARARLEARRQALRSLSQLNLVVDHHGETRAPVITEDQPSLRNLFGTIDPPEDDEHRSDFSCIRAGSVLRADGGFLLLHLRDMVGDEACWQALRRVLRTRQLRIDDVHAAQGPSNSGGMQPELLPLHFKLVLVGSEESYYQMQEHDPDMARRFRVKVDFAEHFKATAATYRATAALMAQRCALYQLPHCDASAVARLLEQSHREADDQQRQSGQLNQLEALLIESAQRARQSGTGRLVQAADVEAALAAHRERHNAMEEALHDAIAEGEHVISFAGSAVGQLNGLSQIDTGDHRFGLPARITARTYAGQEGVLNIEREVALSGPIHDKGVLILQSYLTALFGHLAPLALNASVVFEQEYSGVEGDSASCAELYALLSSLSGLPLLQNIAVTGALNQHGEVLPVGGLNEKIEGWFDLCAQQGLDGSHGVLIPARNQRHLMLAQRVVDAVQAGLFHVHTAEHVSQGIALMMGQCDVPADTHVGPRRLPAAVMQGAEATLLQYRLACQKAEAARPRAQRARQRQMRNLAQQNRA